MYWGRRREASVPSVCIFLVNIKTYVLFGILSAIAKLMSTFIMDNERIYQCDNP